MKDKPKRKYNFPRAKLVWGGFTKESDIDNMFYIFYN